LLLLLLWLLTRNPPLTTQPMPQLLHLPLYHSTFPPTHSCCAHVTATTTHLFEADVACPAAVVELIRLADSIIAQQLQRKLVDRDAAAAAAVVAVAVAAAAVASAAVALSEQTDTPASAT
jgi:hypothetical protein